MHGPMYELIELRHLKYIVAVAETGNFTRAAERLFLTQPALSRQIKDIEIELGFSIFERARDGVVPTPLGQILVDYAKRTLGKHELTFTLAKQIFLGTIPPLRVGFSCFVNPRHLQSFNTGYAREFPNCTLQLSGGDTIHILQRLERGDLDCAILPLPIQGSNWVVEQIASTRLVACMRNDDPLAEHSDVTFNNLVERLTIFRDPDGHPSAHARLLQMITEAGYSVHITCSAATPHDIQLLVKDGYGLALVNEDIALEQGVTTRRISDVQWTADTAFVYASNADHLLLPYITHSLFNNPAKKSAKSERPQLSLKFDLIA